MKHNCLNKLKVCANARETLSPYQIAFIAICREQTTNQTKTEISSRVAYGNGGSVGHGIYLWW